MCTHTHTTNMGVCTRVAFEPNVACFPSLSYIPVPQKRQARFPYSAFPHMVLFWGSVPPITESPPFRHGYMNLIFLFEIQVHSSDLMLSKRSQITAITRVTRNQRSNMNSRERKEKTCIVRQWPTVPPARSRGYSRPFPRSCRRVRCGGEGTRPWCGGRTWSPPTTRCAPAGHRRRHGATRFSALVLNTVSQFH